MAFKDKTVGEALGGMKAQYNAGLATRFRRDRAQLGGGADTHLTPFQLWRVREYVRDMDRNDSIVGQMIDRACDNIVGTGFHLKAKTGDKALDAELTSAFNDWADDATRCDTRRCNNLDYLGWLTQRSVFVDGDIFALPLDDGTLQMMEAHRVGANQRSLPNLVHGVVIDELDRPIAYQFSTSDSHIYHTQYNASYDERPAFDEDGNANVFHVLSPTRVSQTRGVPFAMAVFDILSMFEDVNFATLVQKQVVSCIGLFIEREKDFKFQLDGTLGPRTTVQSAAFGDSSTTETLEEMRPGQIVRGRPGETIKGFSPSVPNPEYFDYVRLLLRIIGAQIGMPLCLTLLDTHDTTFHGYRGELNEARKGFKRRQQLLADRYYTPTYHWRTRTILPSILRNSPSAKKLAATGAIWRHKWRMPGWQYIDPSKDAQADILQINNVLCSPSHLANRRGDDFDETVEELIADHESMIGQAIDAAERLNKKKGGQDITWRTVLQPLVDNQTIKLTGQPDIDEPDNTGKPPAGGKPARPALPAPAAPPPPAPPRKKEKASPA